MDKYLTFLYVRSGNAGVRSIRIPRAVAVCIIASIVAIVVIAVCFITKYAGVMMDAERIAQLEREKDELADRIRIFHKELDDLKHRMAVNYELQNRSRLLASLDPISEDVWAVGIGGPAPIPETGWKDSSSVVIADLEKDIEMLIRQSELELESYREIISILQKEKKIRDSTPSVRPLRGGYLSSRFGRRMDPFTGRIGRHLGVDYRARIGTPVISTADGIITMAKKKGSFGLVIEVNHGNGFKTRYAHLSRMLVKRGQRVKRGEKIGLVGNTGRSTGSHLHYEVIFRKTNRDPLQYIIPEGVFFD
jgi:hypothetical protein